MLSGSGVLLLKVVGATGIERNPEWFYPHLTHYPTQSAPSLGKGVNR